MGLLAVLLGALPAATGAGLRNAALQVMSGEGTTDAEAAEVEAVLWKSFAPLLKSRGFALEPIETVRAQLAEKGVPPGERHAPSNSAANTAIIVRLRELDVELHWMTVLSRDGGETRLALSALGFHDLSSLGNELKRAATLPALEAILQRDAAQIIDSALARFKPVPMPSWWRPPAIAASPAPTVAAAAAPAQPRLPDGARVAVLELRHGPAFSSEDARYLGDVVRAAVLRAAPRLSVMTRENLLVLLQASGKELADCEGECEVDTGRRIGADAVLSGEALKFGARFKLSLRLHETKAGRLLAATVASGATLEELDVELQQRAVELLAGQR